MFADEDDFKKIVERLNIDDKPNPQHRENLRHQMLSAFNRAQQRQMHTAGTWQTIGRTIMKSKITKLAAAAVIILAIFVGVRHFGGPVGGTSVAWADVAERVEQIQTYIHQTTQTLVGQNESSKSMVYYSAEYGKKIEVYKDEKIIMYVYVLLEEKTVISIMPEGKKCQKTSLTEEQLLGEFQGGDPRIIVKQFMSMGYKNIGKNKIDGIETEVIEVENPEIASDMYVSCTGRLWVDVETDLPMRIEIDGVAKRGLGRLTQVVDKFQWNAEFDAKVFEPNIPSDYTVIEK